MSAYDRLTPQLREVARLITLGWTTDQIAAHLDISVHSVYVYMSRIRDEIEADGVPRPFLRRGIAKWFVEVFKR